MFAPYSGGSLAFAAPQLWCHCLSLDCPNCAAAVRRVDHTGQAALHWAAVRGATGAAEALLRGGAAAAARDGRGYSVAHVAAQYGQTAFLHRLALRWNIDIDRCAPCSGCSLRTWSMAEALVVRLSGGVLCLGAFCRQVWLKCAPCCMPAPPRIRATSASARQC